MQFAHRLGNPVKPCKPDGSMSVRFLRRRRCQRQFRIAARATCASVHRNQPFTKNRYKHSTNPEADAEGHFAQCVGPRVVNQVRVEQAARLSAANTSAHLMYSAANKTDDDPLCELEQEIAHGRNRRKASPSRNAASRAGFLSIEMESRCATCRSNFPGGTAVHLPNIFKTMKINSAPPSPPPINK